MYTPTPQHPNTLKMDPKTLNPHVCPPRSQMSVDISAQAKDFDADFIRASCLTLAQSVRDEALGWVKAISQTMRELDINTLNSMRDRIAKYQVALHRKPDTLEELKAVLNTINIIRWVGGWGLRPACLRLPAIRCMCGGVAAACLPASACLLPSACLPATACQGSIQRLIHHLSASLLSLPPSSSTDGMTAWWVRSKWIQVDPSVDPSGGSRCYDRQPPLLAPPHPDPPSRAPPPPPPAAPAPGTRA